MTISLSNNQVRLLRLRSQRLIPRSLSAPVGTALARPPLIVKQIVKDLCGIQAYDIYLLGYHNRDLAVPRQYAKRINAGGGIVHPTLLVDGQVVGTWKSQRQKDHLDVRIEPFSALAPEVQAGLEAEVVDIGRFLGVQATLQVMML